MNSMNPLAFLEYTDMGSGCVGAADLRGLPVRRNTVLSALDKLEKNGYIETEERKTARVIYQGSEEYSGKMPQNILYRARRESLISNMPVNSFFCLCGK